MIRLAAALCLWAGGAAADEVCLQNNDTWLFEACFVRAPGHPVYGHNILGNTPEWTGLEIRYGLAAQEAAGGGVADVRLAALPVGRGIFEDVAPRFIDLDADGRSEIMVVETDPAQGARIVVYGFAPAPYIMATTPYIGQRNRWFSPVGAADLDGDGRVEIGFVDRPHLARVLRIYRYEDGALVPVTAAGGVTNHRIGEPDIAGGIRSCGDAPEMIVASADWTRVLAIRLNGDALDATDLGPHRGRESFAAAMRCAALE